MSPLPKSPWLTKLAPPEPAPPSAPIVCGSAPDTGALPSDTFGLAVGGSGPSATAFALGLIQALARSGWLRWIDFLSTASTGGYAGAFLGRTFDQCGRPDGLCGAIPNLAPGAGPRRAGRVLLDPGSAPLRWLRRTAEYVTRNSSVEAWRNVLSLYVVLAAFVFAVVACAAGLGYATADPAPAADCSSGPFSALTPLTGGRGGPLGLWVWLGEFLFWLTLLPLVFAYWVVSQDRFAGFVVPVLLAATVTAVGVLAVTASPVGLVVLASGVFWALAAWRTVLRTDGHRNLHNPTRLVLAGHRLSRWFGSLVGVEAVVVGLAVIDAAGRWSAARAPSVVTGSVTGGVLFLGVYGVVLASVARRSAAARHQRFGALWAVLCVAGVVGAVVALSAAAHTAFGMGAELVRGAAVTAGAVVVGALLSTPAAVPFVNRSGALMAQAGRFARAFFGAVNPARRTHPDGERITHLIPGDDVPYVEYAPHIAGGPLHLITCAVGATVDAASGQACGRGAVGLTIGPVGLTVGGTHHAALLPGGGIVPIASPVGPNPFAELNHEESPLAALPLRVLIAASGTVSDSGEPGPAYGLGAFLRVLANDRHGYWWDSGRSARWRSVAGWLARVFRTPAMLLAEATARFAGPWERFWHLSDGKAVDPTGAFELLRRRVPYLLVCDGGTAGAAPDANLALLVRRARSDLGAEFDQAPLPSVPDAMRPHLGRVADLLPGANGHANATAVLFLVRYPDGPPNPFGDPWLARRSTWLLYVRPVLTGYEPEDIRAFAATHPEFPARSGVFDTAVWESYRALGEGIGTRLFV